MTNYSSVKNLKWVDKDKTILDCIVKFDFLEKEVPFSTSAKSDTKHGIEIYEKAIKGEFGNIEDYNRNIDFEWSVIRNNRDRLLKESDYTQLPDVQSSMTANKKTEWINYRQQLRDITTAFSDPKNVIWPTIPSK